MLPRCRCFGCVQHEQLFARHPLDVVVVFDVVVDFRVAPHVFVKQSSVGGVGHEAMASYSFRCSCEDCFCVCARDARADSDSNRVEFIMILPW